MFCLIDIEGNFQTFLDVGIQILHCTNEFSFSEYCSFPKIGREKEKKIEEKRQDETVRKKSRGKMTTELDHKDKIFLFILNRSLEPFFHRYSTVVRCPTSSYQYLFKK